MTIVQRSPHSSINFYAASERLPRYLLGPRGSSYKVTETALTEALGTDKPYWDWLGEKVKPDQINKSGGHSGVPDPSLSNLKPDENGLVHRPELEIFRLGMVGGGKVNGSALPFGQYAHALLKASTDDARLSMEQIAPGFDNCGRRCWRW